MTKEQAEPTIPAVARKADPPTEQVNVRLPLPLIDRIDAFAKHLSAVNAMPVTRGAAMQSLLTRALNALEQDQPGPKQGSQGP